ncbi:MAG: prepilin-type N-terminal cleavage/methylation domain-containing protein [Planctomycetales bacterium]
MNPNQRFNGFRRATSNSSRQARGGFTLLEVMLALFLSAIVLGAMWMLINLQFRAVASGRRQVEEAQLVRALLRRIGDDLRSAVLYQPFDSSALAGLGVPLDLEELEELEELPEELTGESSDLGEEDDEAGETSSLVPQLLPGIYGGATELQIDVSRLPRMEQFAVIPTGGPISETRTISYYVISPESADSGTVARSNLSQAPGLYRREMDRATALWAMEQGSQPIADGDEAPIAPEVAALEFRYFDGAEWFSEWDSDDREGLPTAIEVKLMIRPSGEWSGGSTSSSTAPVTPSIGAATEDVPLYRAYRLVVRMPSAVPTIADGIGSEATDEAEAAEAQAASEEEATP